MNDVKEVIAISIGWRKGGGRVEEGWRKGGGRVEEGWEEGWRKGGGRVEGGVKFKLLNNVTIFFFLQSIFGIVQQVEYWIPSPKM